MVSYPLERANLQPFFRFSGINKCYFMLKSIKYLIIGIVIYFFAERFVDLKKSSTFAPLSTKSTTKLGSFGEVAEWSIAAVLKTVEGNTSRGSNPCLSAININNQWFTEIAPDFTPNNVKSGVLVLFCYSD